MIGQIIRRIRIDLGVTQLHVAKSLGVTKQMVHQWESGTKPLGRDRLLEICAALRIDVEDVDRKVAREEATRQIPPG